MSTFRRLGLTVFFLVVSLACASGNALATQSIEDLARDKLVEVSATSAESVPRQKVEELWNRIKWGWNDSYLPLRIGHPEIEPSKILRDRLDGIVSDLIERDAIKVLTPEVKAKLGLNDLSCKYEGHCTSLDGLYLPVNHIIFLDTALDDEEQLRVFLHELIHAYQFTYRLPVDIATLNELVRQGKLKSAEVNLYLDYYYEAQANWKGLQFSVPAAWMPEVKNGNLNVRGFLSITGASGVSMVATLIHASLGATAILDGLGWLFQIAYGNATTNRLLPDIVKSKSLLTLSQPGSNSEAALSLPELVPIDDSMTKVNVFQGYNFDFHRDYGAAIQRYYFGEDRFLFRNDRDDLEIYNTLHDKYYERVGLNSLLETDSDCQALLTKIRRSSISPLVSWLTLPKAELETCSAYRDLGDDDGRAKYLEDLLSPQSQKDPFHTGFPGSEGTRPGLTVLPQLRVLPIK